MDIDYILKLRQILIASVLALSSNGLVMAKETYSLQANNILSTPLAISQSGMAMTNTINKNSVSSEAEFKERWFTANKWHQYLGLGSIALATLTAIVPKPSEDDPETGIHPTLADGAAILGGAAVISGLTFHYKDLSWKNLTKNPDNWHMLLGTLGTLGYVAAISAAPESNHSTYGIVGAVSMLAAIKITW